MADSTAPTSEVADVPPPITNGTAPYTDVEMKDESVLESTTAASPLPSAAAELTAPPRSQPQSRAHTPPARSSPLPNNSTPAPPSQPNPHGSPARVYLNQNVTPHLLEGVKHLAVHEPDKPLKWLAEFLKKKSEEIEGP